MTRIASLALSPTSAFDSAVDLMYVPMPPFHTRSTDALRMFCISSAGVILATFDSMPRASRMCALIGIDFAVRGWIPPPAESRSLL